VASKCGNGIIDVGEDCDGTNFGGATCASKTMNAMPAGTLVCLTSTCKASTSGCQSTGAAGAPGAGGGLGAGGGIGAGGGG
jgi:hypothetical protein